MTAHSYPRPAVAWYTVAVLFILYLLSLLDRLVIALLVAPIRRDLNISDFELSLLQGFAYQVLRTIAIVIKFKNGAQHRCISKKYAPTTIFITLHSKCISHHQVTIGSGPAAMAGK